MTARDRATILADFRALSRHRRLEALAVACDDALAIWRGFRDGGEAITYHDGVVGQRHVVDDELPERALVAVRTALRGEAWDTDLVTQYQEPIVAMHDDDLEFPDEIEYAYYAIYNLFQIATEQPRPPREDVVLDQVASAVDVPLDDWVREWWTRVWDVWATRADLPGPRPLAEPVFAALARGDLAGAIDATDDGWIRAVLLEAAGRHAEAVEAAVAVGGAPLRRWLSDHVHALAPEAIAIEDGRQVFAAIRGEQVVVAACGSGAIVRSERCEASELTRVAFVDGEPRIGGARVDAIGPWGAFWGGLDEGSGGELRGSIGVAALARGLVIPISDRELRVIEPDRTDLLSGVTVHVAAATADGAVIVASDAVSLSIWRRERGDVETLPGCAQHLVIGGGHVLVRWDDGSATLIALTP
jgi:hypothetical protein